MNTTSPTSELRSLISARLRRATRNVTATLKFVPGDKLDFKPSETANSCRELAGHIIEGNGYCLGALGLTPSADACSDIESFIEATTKTGEQLAAFAEQTDEETFNRPVNFFGGEFTVPELLLTAEWHISRHTGQIDYLQTIWGDLEDHS